MPHAVKYYLRVRALVAVRDEETTAVARSRVQAVAPRPHAPRRRRRRGAPRAPQIENKQYVARIEERNEELLRLKMTTGKTVQT